MSNHTPWTQEDAEKWATEYVREHCYPSLYQNKREREFARQLFLAGLAKAAEMIEACPTLYGDTVYTSWGEFQNHEDTHSAKLVGVRPIEGSEK